MSGTFCAIDFETADPQPDSACAVGLVRVESGVVVARKVSLIRPPRSVVTFSRIHGLTWGMLRSEEPFAAVWPRLIPLLDGADELAAHNASFDRRVLEACCSAAGLAVPRLQWVCTLQLARKRWPKPLPNKLPEVCARLGIPFRDHHEAGADAEACARVLVALRAVARTAPVFVRGDPGPGEGLPPATGPFWAIGPEPKGEATGEEGRVERPPEWVMRPVRAGQDPPPWATHWCVEGLPAWVPLPPLVAAEGDTRPVVVQETPDLFAGV